MKIGKLGFSWDFNDKELEIPAGEGEINHTANSSDQENRLFLTLQQKKGPFLFDHAFTLSKNDNRLFWSSLDDFGSVKDFLKSGQFGELKSTTQLVDYRLGYRIIPYPLLTITGIVSGRHEQMIPSTEVGSLGYGEWKSARTSGANATDLALTLKAVQLTLGGSVTVHRSHTEGGKDPYTGSLENQVVIATDPSGRVGISISPKDPISLFANGALYSRTPSLRELFGYHGGVLPSTQLNMEPGETAEIGGSVQYDSFSSELLFFVNHFDNLIATQFDGRVSRAINIGENQTYGIEHSLYWKILPILSIHESMTLQKSEIRSIGYEGNLLPNQPPFSAYFDCSLGSFKGFVVTPQVKWTSTQYRDLANKQRFPKDETVMGKFDLSLFLKWNRDWFSVSGSVRNILENNENEDARYSMESGYVRAPYPGRAWQVEIRTEF